MAEDINENEEKNELPDFTFNREKDDFIFFDSIKSAIIDSIETISARFNNSSNNTNQLKTGFPCLEFDNGNLIVLAARPSIGKTSFALSLIKKLAVEKGVPVGFIDTGTMDNTFLGNKLLSITSGVSYGKIRSAMLKNSDLRKIQETAGKLYDAPIYTAINPNCSFDDFVLSAENMLEEKAVKLIVVEGFDFFAEIVDAEKEYYRYDLGSLMDSFKEFAVKHNIPIVLVMRLPSSDTDNVPGLLDFRKNLVVPYKADMVLFLHRDRIKDDINNIDTKLIISKNVCHATYDIPLNFYPSTGLFEEKKEE